jgi:hypothetical protein
VTKSAGFEPNCSAEWSCTFLGRTGIRAHATFASAEEARRFAERHANATGVESDWVEADGSWVLSTPLGNYRVTPT